MWYYFVSSCKTLTAVVFHQVNIQPLDAETLGDTIWAKVSKVDSFG